MNIIDISVFAILKEATGPVNETKLRAWLEFFDIEDVDSLYIFDCFSNIFDAKRDWKPVIDTALKKDPKQLSLDL